MSAGLSRRRDARRSARISGGAVTSITRTGNRDAASAITVREMLATDDGPSSDGSGGNAVAQSMRLPLQSEVAFGELGFGDGFVGLAAGLRWARNDAADEMEARIVGQRAAGCVQQCVLAGPARSDHANQHHDPAH